MTKPKPKTIFGVNGYTFTFILFMVLVSLMGTIFTVLVVGNIGNLLYHTFRYITANKIILLGSGVVCAGTGIYILYRKRRGKRHG